MKRVFWLGVGVAVGALVVRVVTKRVGSLSPSGIAGTVRDSGRNALDSVRDFVEDVRDGMHEREEELHAAIVAGRSIGDLDEAAGDFDEGREPTLEELDAALGGQPSAPARHSTEDRTR